MATNAADPISLTHDPWPLTPSQWGMLSFLLSEVAFFSTLIAVYVNYMGKDLEGPTPSVLSLPLVIGTTFCLLCSSGTVHRAERSLHHGLWPAFIGWWSA